jgi:hypothetical protein
VLFLGAFIAVRVPLRSSRAPFSTSAMSSQSGFTSRSAMNAASSGGASGTASMPRSQASVSISMSWWNLVCAISPA